MCMWGDKEGEIVVIRAARAKEPMIRRAGERFGLSTPQSVCMLSDGNVPQVVALTILYMWNGGGGILFFLR